MLKSRRSAIDESPAFVVPIQTLAPEPYDLIAPVQAVIRQVEGEYVATFFDANISASGETEFEALDNLKGLIVSMYEILQEHGEAKLGRSSARQKAVLDTFMLPRNKTCPG